MARYLMGSEVTQVFVAGGVMIDPKIGEAGDLDTAITTLWFANGALGAIDNSRQAVYGYDQRVEVLGSEGMAAVSNNLPDTHVHSTRDGVYSSKPLYFFLERYTESFVNEMSEFIESVGKGTPTPVTGADGRAPVVIGMAALKSYKENRPVKIPE
jgi:myo-inositol 2-dehydrogenase/D-chiro-inositol 1-dehydrogenase